ncbi:Hcp family type VI secretion system effector, partial [Proteus mirabilis]|uniref:Hcp family type VI secretion system effector n=3 Tax=Proteus TaxID=583 RepID=UPI003F88F67D
MPTPCYISIEGKTQGNITAGAFTADSVGNIYVQGHEDQMLVQAFSHVVTVPTDPQSGQPSGQRAHKPFRFTVALNKAVPLLYNALASGEMLPKVELKWYRTSVEGKQEHFFTTTLTDATIVNIDCQMPHCQDPAKAD